MRELCLACAGFALEFIVFYATGIVLVRICGKNISGLKCLLDRSVKGIISAKSICVYRSTHCTYIIRRIYCCILVKDHNQTLQQYYGTCKDNHHRVIFPYFRNASKNPTTCFRLSGTYSPEKIAMEILKNRESIRSGTKVEE